MSPHHAGLHGRGNLQDTTYGTAIIRAWGNVRRKSVHAHTAVPAARIGKNQYRIRF